jgi:hypothetical protein
MESCNKEIRISHQIRDSMDISAGTAATYELDGPSSIPDNIRCSLLHRVQDVSGAHPATYSVGTGGGG